jgi:hypothetical protein
MMHLGSSVSDATIWSVTVESSITILEAPFTVFYDVYSTGITYSDCLLMITMFIVQATRHIELN